MSTRILSAQPDGPVTFNATVTTDTHIEVAKLTYKRLKEEGTITLTHSQRSYKITHKTGSGVWKLYQATPHHAGEPLIVARKPKFYSESIRFELEGQVYKLSEDSAWRKDYKVERLDSEDRKDDRALVGQLRTHGIARRGYQITFVDSIRIEFPLFCYWIASLLNKRSAQDFDPTDLLDFL